MQKSHSSCGALCIGADDELLGILQMESLLKTHTKIMNNTFFQIAVGTLSYITHTYISISYIFFVQLLACWGYWTNKLFLVPDTLAHRCGQAGMWCTRKKWSYQKRNAKRCIQYLEKSIWTLTAITISLYVFYITSTVSAAHVPDVTCETLGNETATVWWPSIHTANSTCVTSICASQ